MRVTIVGLGLIGGSLGLDLKKRRFAKEVVGFDASEANARAALKRKLVDRIAPWDRAFDGADLVILAVPVQAIAAMLPKVLKKTSANTTVTDMGSTKERICESISRHPERFRFVASHPMAGTENSGPQAAITGLFDGKTAVICDRKDSGEKHLQRVEAMYRKLKMRLVSMSSAEHDKHVAYVSHLSHVSSFVLANTVLAAEKRTATIFDLAGGGFESTVRLAKSSPEMWGSIFEQNDANVLLAIDSYLKHLQQFRDSLVKRNSGKLHETRMLMADANKIRNVLERIRKS